MMNKLYIFILIVITILHANYVNNNTCIQQFLESHGAKHRE